MDHSSKKWGFLIYLLRQSTITYLYTHCSSIVFLDKSGILTDSICYLYGGNGRLCFSICLDTLEIKIMFAHRQDFFAFFDHDYAVQLFHRFFNGNGEHGSDDHTISPPIDMVGSKKNRKLLV